MQRLPEDIPGIRCKLHSACAAAGNKVGVDDVQALAGQSVTHRHGRCAAQADGQFMPGRLRMVEMDGTSLYGEPVTRLRAQGTMTNDLIKLASINASAPAGSVSAAGSYDSRRRFQIDAKARASMWLNSRRCSARDRNYRKLGFRATLRHLRRSTLDAHATLSPLALAENRLAAWICGSYIRPILNLQRNHAAGGRRA